MCAIFLLATEDPEKKFDLQLQLYESWTLCNGQFGR